MFRKSIFVLVVISIATLLAGNQTPNQVALGDLIAAPQTYLGQLVQVNATVEHVCKHGAKKMLIFDSNPEEAIHVMASDTVPVFDAEANGSNVNVIGVVKENRMTKAEILKLLQEQQAAEAKGNTKPSVTKGEGFGHGESKPAKKDNHKASCDSSKEAGCDASKKEACEASNQNAFSDHPLMKQMAESGKDYVSDYYIECQSYSVKNS